MPEQEIWKAIADYGTTIGILIYFVFRDVKFMQKLDNTLEVIKDYIKDNEKK